MALSRIANTSLALNDTLNLGSAGQIKFPAAQNASSDPNTLDDYEEGTFTPNLPGSASMGTATSYMSATSCYYVKIGSLVNVYGHINIINTIGGGNQWVVVNGFPFPMNNAGSASTSGVVNNYPRGSGYYSGIVLDNTSSNDYDWWFGWNNSTSQVNGDRLYFNITYRTT